MRGDIFMTDGMTGYGPAEGPGPGMRGTRPGPKALGAKLISGVVLNKLAIFLALPLISMLFYLKSGEQLPQ